MNGLPLLASLLISSDGFCAEGFSRKNASIYSSEPEILLFSLHRAIPSIIVLMSAPPVKNYDAVNITRTLKDDGHKPWGFVIYRGRSGKSSWIAFTRR
jgi:hypothetical protein